MDKPVYQVEMELPEEQYAEHQEYHVYRTFAEADHRPHVIRVTPKIEHFVRCPDRASAQHAPENIVPCLVAKEELFIFRCQPFIRILVFRTLSTLDIETKV